MSRHPRQRLCVTWTKAGKSLHWSWSSPACWASKYKDSATVEWIGWEKNSQQEDPRFWWFWGNHLKDLLNINDDYAAGQFLNAQFLHMLYQFFSSLKCCWHSHSLVLRDCCCHYFFFKMPSLSHTSKVSKLLWHQNIKKNYFRNSRIILGI